MPLARHAPALSALPMPRAAVVRTTWVVCGLRDGARRELLASVFVVFVFVFVLFCFAKRQKKVAFVSKLFGGRESEFKSSCTVDQWEEGK